MLTCRQQLAVVVAGMATMRARWHADVQQVEELAVLAGLLFCSHTSLQQLSMLRTSWSILAEMTLLYMT